MVMIAATAGEQIHGQLAVDGQEELRAEHHPSSRCRRTPGNGLCAVAKAAMMAI